MKVLPVGVMMPPELTVMVRAVLVVEGGAGGGQGAVDDDLGIVGEQVTMSPVAKLQRPIVGERLTRPDWTGTAVPTFSVATRRHGEGAGKI